MGVLSSAAELNFPRRGGYAKDEDYKAQKQERMALLGQRRQLRVGLEAADEDLLATLQLELTMVTRRARLRRRVVLEAKSPKKPCYFVPGRSAPMTAEWTQLFELPGGQGGMKCRRLTLCAAVCGWRPAGGSQTNSPQRSRRGLVGVLSRARKRKSTPPSELPAEPGSRR